MANPEHVARLAEGVEKWNQWRWNQWRHNNRALVIDLAGANLYSAELSGADLSRSLLFGAHLVGTNFNAANLRASDLHDADLREANLRGADFRDADLRGACLILADLREANLTAADLREADLRWADISGATLGRTILANTNLSATNGLELCKHARPSSVGFDTFFQAKGEIPEIFLRGCGVPEPFITYARSLVGQAIEFYSCFISYSTKDQEFADQLYADLQNNGVRCWFAPHDIAGGRKVHEQIDEAIRVHDRLLLILSENSMKSAWVETEISKARKRESREERRMLFPVRLVEFETLRDWECFDADTGKDSAREIREYFIPDFSNWKNHGDYKKAFDRLLRDLKARTDAASQPA